METSQIITPSGPWHIKRFFTRGDRRRIDDHVQKQALAAFKDFEEQGIDVEKFTAAAPPQNGKVHDNPDEEDAILVFCTQSWPYEVEVSLDGLMDIPDTDAKIALVEIKRVYGLDAETEKN